MVAYPNMEIASDFGFEYQVFSDLENCGTLSSMAAEEEVQTYKNDKISYRAAKVAPFKTVNDICFYEIYAKSKIDDKGIQMELDDEAENQKIINAQVESHSKKLRITFSKMDNIEIRLFSGTQTKIVSE